ncbi:MAG: type II toxin-antitoxin system HicB family antitoxin [SAR324 cluster bacterium]|nr:type II toxin-antitoxin system HicB family antitoxin [SAR324 cluster bacterium]
MKIKVVLHDAEEGGYWAKVPSLPGCYTQGETFAELLANIYEAVEAYLSVDMEPEDEEDRGKGRVLEIAV